MKGVLDRRLRVVAPRDEDDLARLALRGGPGLGVFLHDRFGRAVNRIVGRLLGPDPEHDDVVHEVFVALLAGAQRVRDPQALEGWVLSVAVNTVRTEIRRRRVRRLFHVLVGAEEIEAIAGVDEGSEGRDLARSVYALLARMPTDERIAFALRYVDERPLAEVADLCGCSLATVKRRIARAEERFARHAAKDPGLAARVGGR